MNRINSDNRRESEIGVFGTTESELSRFKLTYAGDRMPLWANENVLSDRADTYYWFFRAIFMFGPGTFVLFYMTLTSVFYYPGVRASTFSYLFAIFVTYAGAGDLRTIRNLAVPGSVIALAIAVIFFSSLFLGRELADLYFWESIYLFPLVLIVAKLVQAWVSPLGPKTSTNKKNWEGIASPEKEAGLR